MPATQSRLILARARRLALLLALCAIAQAACAENAARIWRVCLGDAAVPPYLNNDPARPGLVEQILLRAGAEVGLQTLLFRYPPARCRAMQGGSMVDAWIVAPTAANLAAFQFPMKGGAIDAGRHILRVNLVWVKRPGEPYEWADGRMLGGAPGKLLVGSRAGLLSASESLLKLGFHVDDKAATTHQLLLKLKHGRVDIAVSLQEEIQIGMLDPALQSLVILPSAMGTAVFYMGVRHGLPPEMQERVEAWWTTIARLREMPQYQLR